MYINLIKSYASFINIKEVFMAANARIYVLASLTFGMSLALMTHFISLWIFGEFSIAEPNTFILSLETISLVAILIFGIFCLVAQMKRRQTRNG